jgi:hypothetical protein
MLSLDGALRHVPAAALRDGEGRLVERYPTVMSAGITLAQPASGPAEAPRAPVTARALGVTRSWHGLPVLQGVAKEIAGVDGDSDGGGRGLGGGLGLGSMARARAGPGFLEGRVYLDPGFGREALAESLARAPR